jgi:ribonuclease Z
MDIRLVQIQPGLIFEGEDFSVSAFPVHHRGPDCYGFHFQEKPRRPFLPEKADLLEIPPGPWRRDLVNGASVILPDGRQIHPEEVLGPARPGTRLVHVGDTGRTDNLVEVSRDADLLVIEATYLDEEAEMASEFSHLTARRAAELAVLAGVKHLILTHISRRYRERDVVAEARSVFPGAVVARDFDVFQVKRGECIRIEGDLPGE